MNKFKADIEIIGINPFVFVPDRILKNIFKQAHKDKGPIPIRGTINGQPYKQTLVKYRGAWRLYINTTMLNNSPKRIGETVVVEVDFDPISRDIKPHPKLVMAFKENKEAKKVFDNLPPSRQNEIVRYISFLKTEKSVVRNIQKAIDHLVGKNRFVGRDHS
jgi:bacteriocin resistance YdeI/OmpD-like protein/uncharacterized protein DUF1905